jgi:hypothetical protein
VNSVVCYLWSGVNLGDRPYQPAHVNVLRKMVARNLSGPHRFICVTDDAKGFDPEVEVMITPMAARHAGMNRSPEGVRFPSCYRRLWTFSRDAVCLGDKVLLIDIDLVLMKSIDHLFKHDVDFMGWRPYRDWGSQLRFGGGIYCLKTGTRTKVWENFKGAASIQRARAAGFRGSDQAWISYCLASTEPYYGKDAGIYSIRDMKGAESNPPLDACLVQFNGPVKPWASPLPWVKAHFR